jgi:AcrR family transcriptional regulator
MERTNYHHGRLPEALLKAAAKLVSEQGVANLSLREVARRAGVSHAAPAHHFTDKAGLLTALAAQGFTLFTAALTEARDAAGDDPLRRLSATGYAYVMFAATHRAHFEIMFQPHLVRGDDPALQAAEDQAYDVLRTAVAATQAHTAASADEIEIIALRAWSQAHGLATLWLTGNIKARAGVSDIETIARAVFPGVPVPVSPVPTAPPAAGGRSAPALRGGASLKKPRSSKRRAP